MTLPGENWDDKNKIVHAEMEALLKKHGIDERTFIYAFDIDGNLCGAMGGDKDHLLTTLEYLVDSL